jgi:hypothetical protein
MVLHKKCSTGDRESNAGRNILDLKRHGAWKSSTIVESYVADSVMIKLDVANSRRADDEFREGILGNQKCKKLYYLNISESGIESR